MRVIFVCVHVLSRSWIFVAEVGLKISTRHYSKLGTGFAIGYMAIGETVGTRLTALVESVVH